MRASVRAEESGIPTVSLVCDGFVQQGDLTASGLGMQNLPFAAHPGHVHFKSAEELQRNVQTIIVDEIVNGLTVQPKEVGLSQEPKPCEIIFKGTFEDVNQFFYSKEWADGLPIVPPTLEKIQQFLTYHDGPADEVIGVLLPDKREATPWNIAANGVMAGCRPEYMPVLVAVVRAMADPQFGQEHLGNTPGTEVLITINGPIIKDLGFNFGQGATRVGFQANTSIGRFWRLYLRNVAGFLLHKTDKATFGRTWMVALAENEDAVSKIGWPPMSVDQGFKAGDNVITINSCTSTDSVSGVGAATAEETLNRIGARIVDIQVYFFSPNASGCRVRPQVLLSPSIAEAIAKGGYSKARMKQYLYEHATFAVRRFEQLRPAHKSLCDDVEHGRLPKCYCESTDPDRKVPIVWSPDDFIITVSGDPARDNCFICSQNGYIGYPVSKKVELPREWAALLQEIRNGK